MSQDATPPQGREPIAIVGIGCRLPGGADSPAGLWRLLCDGADAIGPIPPERFDVELLYDERPATAGKIMTRWGGFLEGIEQFDAGFFGIAPREAERLDPQQRLLLEVAWEALADAGIAPDGIRGAHAGVFVGMWLNEFESHLFADPSRLDLYMTTGSGRYTASGRISYFFDLLGPSITVDTACSSSLVAVHLACQSLWSGESALALAGGANVIMQPHITIAYSQSRMMAPDGRCKFGDARADGYVRSDGAALVVLRRLADAVAAGDPIYAVIRGSAVTNDGRSSGFLATPGQAGQEEMLRRAYANAGVEPRAVHYVEAHGTGTRAGDPVELGALGAVLGAGRPAETPCLVGSIKTNIGHTEGAAGVAGMIKVALALKHRRIPASLHVQQPNPSIPWDDLHLAVCAAAQPWPDDGLPATGGVSSFGIAGTNAHVVLQEAPPAPAAGPSADARAQLLAVSAHTPAALAGLARAYHGLLAAGGPPLADLCYSAGARRSHLGRRLAVVARDRDEAAAALAAVAGGAAHPAVGQGEAAEEPPRVVFVFPGQGSQWLGMARELLRDEPAFAAALARCDAAIEREAGWSPLAELAADEASSRLGEIDVVQPTLFAIQVSLAALWRAWGVEPAAVVGHSMGEVAAAHVAGALSLDDAVAVICRRSRLLRRVRGQGAMAVVDLSVDEAGAAIRGLEDRVAIAVSNSERSTVLSGDPDAIDAVVAQLEARQVFCRLVKVDVASHSPQMDPLLDDLRAALAGLAPRPAALPIYSTVEAAVIDGGGMDAGYWARNLRRPVRFADATRQLIAAGITAFVEISPHPLLLPAVEQGLRQAGAEGLTLASLRRGEPERATLLASLGALYVAGAAPDWPALSAPGARFVPLPAYPWQRERFWYAAEAGPAAARPGGHPLLGHALRLADRHGSTVWETSLDLRRTPFLADHRVQGAAVFPATGFVELALAAAEARGTGACSLDGLRLAEALILADEAARAVQVSVEPAGHEAFGLRVFSTEPAHAGEPAWRLHADCTLRIGRAPLVAACEPPAAIRARCVAEEAGAHYRAMEGRSLGYGPAFRTVEGLWRGEGEVLGRIAVQPDGRGGAARITLLDGCLQLAVAALPAATAGDTFLPVALERVTFAGPAPSPEGVWGYARMVGREAEAVRFDVLALDDDGLILAELRGVELRRAEGSRARAAELLFELRWEEVERPAAAAPDGRGSWLIFAGPEGEAGLAAALAARGERAVLVEAGEAYGRSGADAFALDPADAGGYLALLRDVCGPADPPLRGVVFAWGAGVEGCARALLVTQALAARSCEAPPRLWLLTRGAQPAGDAEVRPDEALVWGLGRVAASELPNLRPTLVDRGYGDGEARSLAAELWAGAGGLGDDQVALRGGRRFVARLVRREAGAAGQTAGRTAPAGTPYRVAAAAPGNLDSLRPREVTRRVPGPGEIEVKVAAAGVNFIDVLKALGAYPGLEPSPENALGAEAAGTVVAVGAGVTGLQLGDEVVVITPAYDSVSCLSSFVTVPAAFAVPRPAGLSAEQAAGLPVVFLTAYYALHELGRLRRGERVLVHAAAGGVGLAAIQLCRRAGAEVFATAGSPEKRDFLRSLGVEHVFDSRTLDFAGEVLAATGGRGVDLLLNSLAGEAIQRSLEVLGPRGRFVEIGKRDIYANSRIGLEPFRRNLAFFAVDLARLTAEDPAYVAGLFHEVMGLVAAGELRPLPTQTFPAAAVDEAFRALAQARHIGKLVVSLAEPPVAVEAVPPGAVRAGATYLITGGLGALGLEVARWLVGRGARHLALLGRSAPSPGALAAIAELEAAGAQVVAVAADVADGEGLRAALGRALPALPPLRGVVHAAGLLADATLAELSRGELEAALAPKVRGARNLHTLTEGERLDFFVLFSSAAALLGLAGQANYAAGNAYLDALAHARRAAGLPALSVNWGPWAGVGLAAAQENRGARLGERGLGSINPREALEALGQLLAADVTQAAAMRFDARQWAAQSAGRAVAPLLAGLVEAAPDEGAAGPAGLREALLAVEPGRRRRGLLEDAARAQLAQVLRIAPERIERQKPLKSLGLDSLMALELRNRLEAETGLTLSATLAWNYPTIAILADHLAERMAITLDGPPAEPATDAVELLADDEVEAMLSDELAAIERLLNSD